MTNYEHHPFKEAIRMMLHTHFPPQIVDKFSLVFEVEMYNKDSVAIRNQLKADQLILEVHYNENGIDVYICDLFPWMDHKQCEYKLLRYITDKLKANEIGKNWEVMSNDVKSGKLATPIQADEPIITKKEVSN